MNIGPLLVRTLLVVGAMRFNTVALLAVVVFTLVGSSGCSGSFRGNVLAAVPIAAEPGEDDWERAVPLDLDVWMGNVHERPEIVTLDRQVSHRSTAACHHGPQKSRPVRVRLMALYSEKNLFLKAQWVDDTMDDDLGVWTRQDGIWVPRPGVDDGIAIIWGAQSDGAFSCRSACHMAETDIFDGDTERRMTMMHTGEGILDLWRFRSAVTAPFGLADDMFIDRSGKRGDEEQTLVRDNRPEDLPDQSSDRGGEKQFPYYSVMPPYGMESDVKVVSGWERGVWTVLFQRRLDSGDIRDRVFAAGEEFPFAVAVFDNTWSEHHVSDRNLVLILAGLTGSPVSGEEVFDDPLDF